MVYSCCYILVVIYTIPCFVVSNKVTLEPISFALTLRPIMEKVKREIAKLLINMQYIDDGTPRRIAQKSSDSFKDQ